MAATTTATSPEVVQHGLALTLEAAGAEITAAAQAGETPTQVRDLLYAAAPLVVETYGTATSALALDWYDHLRALVPNLSVPDFTLTPVVNVRYDHLDSTVSWATSDLYDMVHGSVREATREESFEEAVDKALAKLLPDIEREVANAFADSVTENVDEDPDSVGWRRYARAGACKFCKMLADKGAIYDSESARFAAHVNCMCLCGPVFTGDDAPEASAEQYMASKRKRTPAEKKALRDYLNLHYPDAPG